MITVCLTTNILLVTCIEIFFFLGDISTMLVEAVSKDGKSAWKCLVCGKEFPHKHNGKRHIETMHYEAPSYECEVCGKVLKNINTYQNHISITHGIKKRAGQTNR